MPGRVYPIRHARCLPLGPSFPGQQREMSRRPYSSRAGKVDQESAVRIAGRQASGCQGGLPPAEASDCVDGPWLRIDVARTAGDWASQITGGWLSRRADFPPDSSLLVEHVSPRRSSEPGRDRLDFDVARHCFGRFARTIQRDLRLKAHSPPSATSTTPQQSTPCSIGDLSPRYALGLGQVSSRARESKDAP
jgi:hypothetical protein